MEIFSTGKWFTSSTPWEALGNQEMPPVKQTSVVFSAVMELPVVAVLMQRSGKVQV